MGAEPATRDESSGEDNEHGGVPGATLALTMSTIAFSVCFAAWVINAFALAQSSSSLSYSK